jgi:hypothetical protein
MACRKSTRGYALSNLKISTPAVAAVTRTEKLQYSDTWSTVSVFDTEHLSLYMVVTDVCDRCVFRCLSAFCRGKAYVLGLGGTSFGGIVIACG